MPLHRPASENLPFAVSVAPSAGVEVYSPPSDRPVWSAPVNAVIPAPAVNVPSEPVLAKNASPKSPLPLFVFAEVDASSSVVASAVVPVAVPLTSTPPAMMATSHAATSTSTKEPATATLTSVMPAASPFAFHAWRVGCTPSLTSPSRVYVLPLLSVTVVAAATPTAVATDTNKSLPTPGSVTVTLTVPPPDGDFSATCPLLRLSVAVSVSTSTDR